ncbi:MAG: exo-alpha-sialidase [Planctomycetes bacterium]|nr:exo-alpha-sialidase [Planctomycetota bacterium]
MGATLRLIAGMAGLLVAPLAAAGESGPPGEGRGAPVYQARAIHEPTKRFPSSHCSAVTQTKSGDLLCCWYSGSAEKGKDVAVIGSRLPKGADRWEPVTVWQDEPNKSEGNPVLWTDPTGVVWFFYEIMHGGGWSSCTLHYRTSADEGRTWSEQQTMHPRWGINYKNHPVVLSSGRWLLPCYNELLDQSAIFFYSDDQGKTWTKGASVRRDLGDAMLQPTVIERRDGSLYAMMRCGKEKRLWEMTSADGGLSWSRPELSAMPNPGAAAEMVRLASGAALLVFNDNPSDRTPLTAALSDDEGRTWKVKRDLKSGPGGFHYPSAIQTRDGLIQVTYTDNRRFIGHLTFNEAWVRAEKAAAAPATPATPAPAAGGAGEEF